MRPIEKQELQNWKKLKDGLEELFSLNFSLKSSIYILGKRISSLSFFLPFFFFIFPACYVKQGYNSETFDEEICDACDDNFNATISTIMYYPVNGSGTFL